VRRPLVRGQAIDWTNDQVTTRRSLIRQALLLVLGIDVSGLSGCVSSRGASTAAKVPPASGMLSKGDMDDLLAFGEVLVEGRALTAAERRELVEAVESSAGQTPENLSLYRTAVSALAHVAGRRFASLAIHERLELVTRLHLASSRVRSGEDLGEFSSELRTLRTRVVPELIRGYYGSPAGWAAVGYQTFPGRCGDLTRYTRAES